MMQINQNHVTVDFCQRRWIEKMLHHKNKIKAFSTGLLALPLLFLPFAHGAVVDRPAFSVGGVVIVWGGDGAGNARVNDFIIAASDGSSLDLIGSDVTPVVTGSLDSFSTVSAASLAVSGQTLNDQGTIGVLDAGDSFAEFSPSETVTTRLDRLSSSFYVASNTAFSIKAIATLDTVNSSSQANLNDIYRTMTVRQSGTDAEGTLSYGSSSQYPHSDDSPLGGVINNGFLNTLSTEKLVFQGDRATAIDSGTIADQSVRFTNTYEMASGDGFEVGTKKITANVVYTVAIP